MAFNSLMTSVYRGSDLGEIVDGLIAHMRTQMEHPALLNSRFVFDEFLRLDIRFNQLNLMRGSSYLPLPNWIAKKKAIINPKNMNDGLCFRWAVIAADKWMDIDYNPERISSLIRFAHNYDWSGIEFPVSMEDISTFEINNNFSVNVLAVEGRDIYIHRKGQRRWIMDPTGRGFRSDPIGREINWLLISDYESGRRHYAAIKSLSRLLRSSNTKHKCKQHFCMNCLQGFSQEFSRDAHQVYCEDNETIKVEMPKESKVEFKDGQNQFNF